MTQVRGQGQAWVALLSNVVLMLVKLGGGLAFGSQALVADGVHALSDTLGSLAVVLGVRVASQPPDDQHPYGHEKAETVAAFVVGLLLALAALWVAGEALGTILSGRVHAPHAWALWIALASAVAKEGLYWNSALAARRLRSAALLATAQDHRSDVLTSLAAVAGIIGARYGWPLLDPLMALFVSLLLLVWGWRIVVSNVDELLEARAHAELNQAIAQVAGRVPGVVEVTAVRSRNMGPVILVDLKIAVDPAITVQAGHDIAGDVTDALHRAFPDLREVLVHVNPVRT